MGSGSFSAKAYADYATTTGKTIDHSTGYVLFGQKFASKALDSFGARDVVRECINTTEHPNTVPVILALDVTGSMGSASNRTASALGKIALNLIDKNPGKDLEFLAMGIGDIEYDRHPIQVSQFESDKRILESMDNIYQEHGGGPNDYESYSAAWYFGLYQTKLDAFDKQNRKGIIITMGDEPLNPILETSEMQKFVGVMPRNAFVNTNELYAEAKKKFDIYHIIIDDASTYYGKADSGDKVAIEDSWSILGKNLFVSTIKHLPEVIEECIQKSISTQPQIV